MARPNSVTPASANPEQKALQEGIQSQLGKTGRLDIDFPHVASKFAA